MQRFRIALFTTLLCLSVLWLFRNLPQGADWHWVFYAVPKAYLAGDTRLFDEGSVGWLNPPWLLPLLLPFAALSESDGLFIIRVLALAVFGWCVLSIGATRREGLGLLAPVLTSILVWATVIAGNVDFIVLGGLVLFLMGMTAPRPILAGLGLSLALVKPQLGLVPALAFLPELRSWTWPMRSRLLLGPLVSLGLAFAMSGLDWPARWWLAFGGRWDHMESYNVSISHGVALAAGVVGLPVWMGTLGAASLGIAILRFVWRMPDARRRFAIGVALIPLFSNYLSAESLSLAMVASWPQLLRDRRYWSATLAYACQFLLLARGFGDREAGALVSFFSVVLLAALLMPESRIAPSLLMSYNTGEYERNEIADAPAPTSSRLRLSCFQPARRQSSGRSSE